MGQCVSRRDARLYYQGKGPLAMESKTYVGNTCIRKEWRGVANRGKAATNLPNKRYLVGGWRTRENIPSRGAPVR